VAVIYLSILLNPTITSDFFITGPLNIKKEKMDTDDLGFKYYFLYIAQILKVSIGFSL